jgi:multimeric flavodoxin WrbA
MKMKVNILGISGSPRKGTTDIIVKTSLDAAQTLGDVETRFIGLAKKKITPCFGCWRCHTDATKERFCPQYKDDMQEIYEAMLWADGMIIGTPVYWGSVSAQIKAVLDRTMPFCHYSSTFKGELSHKVVGAVTVAYDKNGGQEYAIQVVHNWALVQDMVVVGSGPGTPVCCYYGGAAYCMPSDAIDAVKKDGQGMKSCRGTGMRVAHLARIIKSGIQALDYDEPLFSKIELSEKGELRPDEVLAGKM